MTKWQETQSYSRSYLERLNIQHWIILIQFLLQNIKVQAYLNNEYSIKVSFNRHTWTYIQAMWAVHGVSCQSIIVSCRLTDNMAQGIHLKGQTRCTRWSTACFTVVQT